MVSRTLGQSHQRIAHYNTLSTRIFVQEIGSKWTPSMEQENMLLFVVYKVTQSKPAKLPPRVLANCLASMGLRA